MSGHAGLAAAGAAGPAADSFWDKAFERTRLAFAFKHVRKLSDDEELVLRAFNQEFSIFKYIVIKPYSKKIKVGGVMELVEVPIGFVCDGASGGIDALAEEEWLLHDWLYSTHKTKNGTPLSHHSEADDVFTMMHRRFATKLFGYSAWVSSGKRGPVFLKESGPPDNRVLKVIVGYP